MIEKLKDFWSIFKNSKYEFYKEKNEAIELLERVKYINSLISTVFKKNKEILHYLNANISDYPKCMHKCINDLISLYQYGYDSKILANNGCSNLMHVGLTCIIENVRIDCHVAYNYMNENFNKKDCAKVKEKYIELIKNLRDYEKKYDMVILDKFYDYDKI